MRRDVTTGLRRAEIQHVSGRPGDEDRSGDATRDHGPPGSRRRPRLAVVLASAVVIGSLAVLAVGVVLPWLAGATTHAVVSDSMRPYFERGDLVVVRDLPVEEGATRSAPDREAGEQLRAEVWYAVPWLGHVSAWASPAPGAAAVPLLAGGLAGYAVVVLTRARRPALG